MTVLIDAFNRRLSYLRLSVTDLCNFRCNYCLPNGYQGKAKPNELTLAEIQTLVKVFAQNGTSKIRLTGGEPTLRRDIVPIIEACKKEGITVALTTNGYRLDKLFPQMFQAGLDKLNVSVDSFDPERFYQITGKRECENILRTLDQIIASGFTNIKINTLLLKEYFDDSMSDVLAYVKSRPITLRFIELMQTRDNLAFFHQQHISAQTIENHLKSQGWVQIERIQDAGPAREYTHQNYLGRIGFIAPYSQDFCQSCNRLRVTAQGKLHLCLFGGVAYDLRKFLHTQDSIGLQNYLYEIINLKPEHHFLHQKKVGLIRDLSMIGG